jgi:hypothetical protein
MKSPEAKLPVTVVIVAIGWSLRSAVSDPRLERTLSDSQVSAKGVFPISFLAIESRAMRRHG